MNTYLVLVTLSCIVLKCLALPDGAPQSACSSMEPIHPGIAPQQSPSPFTVSAEKIGEGKVKVTISSNDGTQELPFQGFMLQARSALDRNKFIAGEFSNSEYSKAIKCHGQRKSTLTHKNTNPKSVLTTEWTSGVSGDVVFRATVARSFSDYWKDIDSAPLKMETDVKKQSTEKVPVNFMYDACHELNNCVGMPEKCIEKSNCRVLLAYENHDGNIKFTMQGLLNESEYMAMGLSEDNIMGEDFVTECFRNGANDVILQNSWNEGKSNTLTTEASVTYDYEIVDGITKCTWTETNVTNSNGKTYDFVNEKYYILLAQGPIKHGRLSYHTFKISSSEPIEFFERDSVEIVDDTRDFPEGATNEPEEKLTTKSNAEDFKTAAPNNCSLLNFSLFYLILEIFAYKCFKSSIL